MTGEGTAKPNKMVWGVVDKTLTVVVLVERMNSVRKLNPF
jgi:hypothetical protein